MGLIGGGMVEEGMNGEGPEVMKLYGDGEPASVEDAEIELYVELSTAPSPSLKSTDKINFSQFYRS